MMLRKTISRLSALALFAGGLALPLAAQAGQNAPFPRMEWVTPKSDTMIQQFAQNRISASQAKRIALSREPGATFQGIRDEGNFYKVILVRRDGRRVVITVDARTGAVR